jgi:D-sedoheptulose 7-phosphate isomerase
MRIRILKQIREARSALDAALHDTALVRQLERATRATLAAYRAGHKVLLAGNGGSAADAQHLAGELVNRFRFDRPGLPAIALTTDSSVLTSIANDSGYDQVFTRQVEALGRPGDVLWAFSTSGRSLGILAALDTARRRKLVTVGFTGQAGGDMAKRCDIALVAPSRDTPRIQEIHALAGHILCELIEANLFGKTRTRKTAAR